MYTYLYIHIHIYVSIRLYDVHTFIFTSLPHFNRRFAKQETVLFDESRVCIENWEWVSQRFQSTKGSKISELFSFPWSWLRCLGRLVATIDKWDRDAYCALSTGWTRPMGLEDASSCRSRLFSAKNQSNIGLFCGKWLVKIRHPMGIRHPVPWFGALE